MSDQVRVRLTGDVSDLKAALGSGGREVRQFTQQAGRDLGQLGQQGSMSLKQIEWAGRNLPAQLTDIVTSLQAGQRPLTVLLQQGGQIKDMYGGVGAALSGVTSYVKGLINPVTIAAGALGLIVVAAYKGSQELRGFQNAAILSGNAAQSSAGSYALLRDQIVGIAGTRGKASEALTAIAGTSLIAGNNVKGIAEAAILMEKATGEAIGKTVEKFVRLSESPTAAAMELNKQLNFLTAGTYAQIRALEEQGQKAQAASIAEAALADAMKQRATAVVENLGWLEKAWRGTGNAAKWAWDQMLNIGRESTLDDKIKALQERIEGALRERAMTGAYGRDGIDRGIAILREQLNLLTEQQRLLKRGSEAAADRAAAEKAAVAAVESVASATERYASKQDKLNKALADYRRDLDKLRNGPSASSPDVQKLLDPKAIAQVEAGIRKQYAPTPAAGDGQLAGIEAKVRELREYLQTLRQGEGEVAKWTEGQRLVARLELELAGNIGSTARAMKERMLVKAKELALLEDEVRGQEKLKAGEENYRKLVSATAQAALTVHQTAEAQEAANAAFGKSKTAIEQLKLQHLQRSLALDKEAHAGVEYLEGLDRQIEAQKRYVKALQDAESKQFQQKNKDLAHENADHAALLQLELSLVGQTQEVRQRIVAVRQVELEYAKKIREVERSSLTDAEKSARIAEIRTEEAAAKANAMTRSVLAEWERTNERIADSFVDNLMRGGKSVAQYFKDLFRTQVGQYLKDMFRQMFSPSGPGGGGGGSIIDMISGMFRVGGQGGGQQPGGTGGPPNPFVSSSPMGGANPAFLIAAASALGTNLIGKALGYSEKAMQTATTVASFTGILPGLLAGALVNGEKRVGGQYRNTDLVDRPSGGPIAGATDAIGATITNINQTLKSLGSTAQLATLVSGLEQSERGRGFAYAGGALTTGTVIGQGVDGRGYMNRRGDMTSDQALAALGEELMQVRLEAVQASDATGELVDWVRSLGDISQYTGSRLKEVSARLDKAMGERATLEDRLFELTHTAMEVQARDRTRERDALDETNRALYDQVAALMDAKAATELANAAQRQLAETLSNNLDQATQALMQARRDEADALRENINNLTSAAARYRSFAVDLRRFRDSLLLSDLSPLTPKQKYEESRRIAAETYARALTGDQDAMGQIQNVASDFLRASQVYNASGEAYLRDFATVQSYLAVGITKADEAASWAEAQAAIGQAQLSALEAINASVLTVAQAVQNLYNAGAAVVNAGGQVGDGPLREYLQAMHSTGRGAEALDALRGAGRTMAQGNELMSWQPGTIESWARAAGVPVFHDGTPSVPSTGLAVVQQHETIMSRGGHDALLAEFQKLRGVVEALLVQHGQGVQSSNAATLAAADKIVEGVTVGAGRNAWARRNALEAVPQ